MWSQIISIEYRLLLLNISHLLALPVPLPEKTCPTAGTALLLLPSEGYDPSLTDWGLGCCQQER